MAAAQHEFGEEYHGVLYGQFMLTANGPKLIETNVRFGDPEAINLVSLLKTDPAEVFMGAAGRLPEKVEFEPQASVCKYLVPEGYPMSKPVTARVSIDERVLSEEGTRIVYAGAEAVDGKIQSTGSRFAAVLAIRPSVAEAEAAVERTLERLQLDGVWHRRDIATAALLQKRVDHMRQVHGNK
jgi:Phosphoribosylamine-glycine ligase